MAEHHLELPDLVPSPEPREPISRRAALRSLGVGLAVMPVVGCSSSMASLLDGGSAADGSATGDDASTDAAAMLDAGADAAASDAGGEAGWASGGTASMTGAASYPDPFEGASGSACALTVAATLGPCYYTTPLRRDVSEGYPGLPVRLALRVVDTDCNPIEDARVEIWHTRNSGLYSGGPTSMCTSGDSDALAHLYFRGGQVTDEDGRVDFDTCFPGWYSGRAVHIHFQVFLADGSRASVISQLFFPAERITEIFASHVDYASFGQPDTPNASDRIYTGVGSAGVVELARMSDGAMQAWKQIVVG